MATSCCPSAVRRFLLIFAIAFCLSVLFHQHMVALFRLGSVYVFWPWLSAPNAISYSFDGFDTSFEKYPRVQWSASWPPTSSLASADNDTSIIQRDDLFKLANGSYTVADKSTEHFEDLVPPILHHILLGMDRETMPESWKASRQSCLE